MSDKETHPAKLTVKHIFALATSPSPLVANSKELPRIKPLFWSNRGLRLIHLFIFIMFLFRNSNAHKRNCQDYLEADDDFFKVVDNSFDIDTHFVGPSHLSVTHSNARDRTTPISDSSGPHTKSDWQLELVSSQGYLSLVIPKDNANRITGRNIELYTHLCPFFFFFTLPKVLKQFHVYFTDCEESFRVPISKSLIQLPLIRGFLREGYLVLRFSLRYFFSSLRRLVAADFHTKWRIGRIDDRGQVFLTPKNHLNGLADPSFCIINGKRIILCEEISATNGLGRITRLEFEGSAIRAREMLSSNEHLSFPNVFHYGGQNYFYCDTRYPREIGIFPIKFNHEDSLVLGSEILLPITGIVDPIFIWQDSILFLIGTRALGSEHYSCLEIYMSKEPFIPNRWTRHPLSPIMVNVNGGRNGGTFRLGKNWFRVGQNHQQGSYGKSVTLFRIDELSEVNYKETEVLVLDNCQYSIHHLNYTPGEGILFDFKGRVTPKLIQHLNSLLVCANRIALREISS